MLSLKGFSLISMSFFSFFFFSLKHTRIFEDDYPVIQAPNAAIILQVNKPLTHDGPQFEGTNGSFEGLDRDYHLAYTQTDHKRPGRRDYICH